jgi:hypothetical protein
MRRSGALVGGLLIAVFALSQQVVLAAAGDPQKKLSAADTRLAAGVLLKRGDLGSGWKSSSSASGAPGCGIVHQLQPNESDLVETGAAAGSLFTNKAYEALSQTVRVFASPQQATKAWLRTVNKQLVICTEQQVEDTSSMGSAVSVTDWTSLRLPHQVEHASGFRVTASAGSGTRKTKVYFDLILLGHARAMTRIALSSLQKPFSAQYEAKLVQLVSQRLNSVQRGP